MDGPTPPHPSRVHVDDERQRRLGDRHIVYGVFSQGRDAYLLFLPRAQAEHTAGLFQAFCTVDTWGDLRRALDREQAADLGAWLRANGPSDRRPPRNDAPFHPDDIPGLLDGDWPAWPDQLHVAWMPRAITERFGAADTDGSGRSLAAFASADERRVVAALRARGYTVSRDDELVAHACGYLVC